jgi:ribosome-associated protein
VALDRELAKKDRTAVMTTLPLKGDHITLAQAVKAAGLAESGGQAKQLVRSGTVTVNGTIETRPGRKLVAGDRFRVAEGPEWTISR